LEVLSIVLVRVTRDWISTRDASEYTPLSDFVVFGSERATLDRSTHKIKLWPGPRKYSCIYHLALCDSVLALFFYVPLAF
jgi:hypothetical protein